MFPPECQKTVAIYHLPTTGGTSQAFPASADATVTGAFLPMDDKAHALQGGDFVDPHEVYFDPTVDVRTGDKLVIDSVTYYVRKVMNAYAGALGHKRASISRDAHA